MSNIKSTRSQLVKETAKFAQFMGDMEMFFTRQWKDGAGASMEVKEYVGQKQLDTLIEAFGSMAKTLEVIHNDISAIEAKQSKQDISIVKAGRAKLRVTSPVAEEVVRAEVVATAEKLEWAEGLKLLDPELYTKNGRIYYFTLGLSPKDIQYNEFDLALIAGEFELSDTKFIMKRWSTFAFDCKKYVNCTLSEFIRAYAQRRGIEYTPQKRGRKAQEVK